MIINKSGIVIRLAVSECRTMGRATQGVRLINLTKKNDVIASVCKTMSSEFAEELEEKNRSKSSNLQDIIQEEESEEQNEQTDQPLVDFDDEINEE